MAEAFFSAVNYPLSLLIQNIEAGEIALSGIQRPFVWPHARIRDLFDSMYRGFPVGYLLFAPYDGWRAGSGPQKARSLIVDGQQRLTSLYSVVKGVPVMRDDFREERIRVAFRPSDGRFEISDAAILRDPEFVPDIGPLLSGQVPQYRFVREFLERLRVHRPVGDAEEARLSSAIYRLYELQGYPFTVLQLSRSLDEEQVAEVFVRINSRGVPLSLADFALTLMAVAWEEGRRDLEAFCRRTRELPTPGESSPANELLHPTPDQLLRVGAALAFRRARLGQIYSILQGRDPESRQPRDELRSERFGQLQRAQRRVLDPEAWLEFLDVVRTAGYRGADMLPSQMALLHCYTVFLLGKEQAGAQGPALRGAIARWVFFTALTGRYSGSAESAAESDLARLSGAPDAKGFVTALEEMIAAALTEEYWSATLPAQLATTSQRSSALMAYFAALNVMEVAELFSAKGTADRTEEAGNALEKRQLFPRRQLARTGGGGHEASQVANLILVAPSVGKWSSARECRAKLVAAYSPRRLAELERGHALPENWTEMEYQPFLEARRKAMAGVTREALARLGARRTKTAVTIRATQAMNQ